MCSKSLIEYAKSSASQPLLQIGIQLDANYIQPTFSHFSGNRARASSIINCAGRVSTGFDDEIDEEAVVANNFLENSYGADGDRKQDHQEAEGPVGRTIPTIESEQYRA